MTITGLQLPANTTYATGYTTSALTTPEPGCLAGDAKRRDLELRNVGEREFPCTETPLTVGASGTPNNPLVVTLTNDATMGPSAPIGLRWRVPLNAVSDGHYGHGGSAVSTTTPAMDGWSS